MHRDFFFARSWLYYGNICCCRCCCYCSMHRNTRTRVRLAIAIPHSHTWKASFTVHIFDVCEPEQKVPIVGVSCNLNIFLQPLTAMRNSCTLIITVQFPCADCGRPIVYMPSSFSFFEHHFLRGHSNRPMSICISLQWNSQLLSFWTAETAEDVSDARKIIIFRCTTIALCYLYFVNDCLGRLSLLYSSRKQ